MKENHEQNWMLERKIGKCAEKVSIYFTCSTNGQLWMSSRKKNKRRRRGEENMMIKNNLEPIKAKHVIFVLFPFFLWSKDFDFKWFKCFNFYDGLCSLLLHVTFKTRAFHRQGIITATLMPIWNLIETNKTKF